MQKICTVNNILKRGKLLMKKLVSLALILVLCISMMAGILVSAEGTSATVTFDDAAKRTEFSTEKQVWVENGITVTNNKGESKSNVADYVKPARFYSGSELIIAYPGMMQIDIACNRDSDAKNCQNAITVGTVSVNGKVVSIVLPAAADSYTITLSAGQVRVDSITVHTSVVGGGEGPEVPEVPADPTPDTQLTIAEALALGASKEHNQYTEGKYYVAGEIVEVYNEQYGNMRIKDAEGNILTVYGTYSADGSTRYDALEVKPVAGDTVKIYGIVGQYGGTAQIKNGWIVEHTPAEVEPPVVDPENPGTGDSTAIFFVMALMAISLGGIVLVKKVQF